MQFINKYQNREKGHRIIKSFIKEHWDDDCQKYVNLNYDELKRCKKFQHLLLNEQQGYCCYCMRKIPPTDVTLEHVIPRNLGGDDEKKKKEFKYYMQFGYLKPRRIYYSPQIPASLKLHTPPYPHSIAYENLVASCNGRIYDGGSKCQLHACCNNFRGNEKIIPLFFLPRISQIVQYEKDGALTYDEEKYGASIDLLNLRHPTLFFIRKIWARIVTKDINMSQVKSALEDEKIRQNIIDDLDIPRADENKLKLDMYWKLFLEFHWFYYYFTNKSAK